MVAKDLCRSGLFVALGAVVCAPSFGEESSSQIQRLMRQKQEKYAALEACSQKVQGFKIAGISTLGLTAVGIGANVAISNKKQNIEKQIEATKTSIDRREQQLVTLKEEVEVARVEKQRRDALEEERIRQQNLIDAQRQAACVGIGVVWDFTDKQCKCADSLAVWNATKNACERPVEQKAETPAQSSKPNKTSGGGSSSQNGNECVKNIKALLKIEKLPVGTVVVFNSSGGKIEVPGENTKYYNDLAQIAKDYTGASVSASAQSAACDKFVFAKNKVDAIFEEDKCIKSLVDRYSKLPKKYLPKSIVALTKMDEVRDDGVFSKVEGDMGPCKWLKELQDAEKKREEEDRKQSSGKDERVVKYCEEELNKELNKFGLNKISDSQFKVAFGMTRQEALDKCYVKGLAALSVLNKNKSAGVSESTSNAALGALIVLSPVAAGAAITGKAVYEVGKKAAPYVKEGLETLGSGFKKVMTAEWFDGEE